MEDFLNEKIFKTCERLQELSRRKVCTIDEMRMCESEYKKKGEMPCEEAFDKIFKKDDRIAGRDKHFWFSFKIKTPKLQPGKEYRLIFTTGYEGQWDALNPQGLMYLNGEVVCGIDINHRELWIEADKEYDVLIYFYVGMIETDTKFNAELYEIDLGIESLVYDLQIPYEAAFCLNEEDYNHVAALKCLEQACNIIDFRDAESSEFRNSVNEAAAFMKDEFYDKLCGKSLTTTSYVGHTHIDVAWQWTVAQTREKTQRSFSTVLRLMEKYPEYIFMSSQPQLYQYVKEEEPQLYEKIKERVKEGRWEVDGAMWLEADCNLSSGESLVRQILHGKKFIKDEFDTDSHILWLPDVFGYCASLPQILKKSGVDKFVTSKISWSETNKMPYDMFMWQGIDGTEIFTYFLTAQTHDRFKEGGIKQTSYVGKISSQMNLGTWERFQQKEYSNDVIVTFGWGDGGGGPTFEMLENARRLKYGLPGMPKAEMTTAGKFLETAEKNFNENCEKLKYTPKWVGELYLELHRGTYTSIAKNKRKNRKSEFLCQHTETLAVMDTYLWDGEYPADLFEKNWKRILLNQFHDIIPGSSIKEVYQDSDADYEKVYNEIGGAEKKYINKIAENVCEDGVLVYNPNSFVNSSYVEYENDFIYAENIPAFGWKVVKPSKSSGKITVSDKLIETPFYIARFDDNMNIESLFDKENGREVSEGKEKLNQLKVFEDIPREWDNWEITSYYKKKMWKVNNCDSVETVKLNGAVGFKIVRKYMKSVIKQTILFYEKSRRIDFVTEADWHEKHVLLKAAFPVDINANKATYEIQFGNVERPTCENTSWDKAKFEVCAQKWCDLSEENYGVSLLNDCKYGHSTLGSEMTITLIKCGTFPNEDADQGHHEFTYSLLPHSDSFKKSGVIQEAYKLNCPMYAVTAYGKGKLDSNYSFLSCDADNIIIETIKQAENGSGIIVRLYDSWNMRSSARLNFGFEAKKIFLCDLMENPLSEIGSGKEVCVNVSNFEIVTLLVIM